MIRVVVAEDQWAVRSGLVMILDSAPDIEVVAEAADGEEAVAAALRARPDVVLMDVRMPRKNGITAARELAAQGIDVLILTTFDLDEYVFGALRAGAAGFLLKNIEADDLTEAVRVVARGEGMIAPAVTRRLIREFAGGAGAMGAARGAAAGGAPTAQIPPAAVAELTPREREVLGCVGEGLSNRQIARRLGITETTTKTHVSRILAKLGLRSRVQAAIAAQELGLAE
ncbi:response regulator [Streptomonospora nanhaiensis]|uniref:DNA-binding NarL/FixJ family response regulator n=1 Tax=Streptomonospora nanhaiensis TaxID=1323731 RepID=A0A853BHA5_9ACTN|nr:response regulator transcription factor [Streptomonospora nanhaiensis]MBV2367239.1 response regulator transcription factor [Streptomonospora nanhaiensis]MBX9391828.1 response regulator transcription factor [Streptomonospora nanhaiensis]NYI93992.1 DNA-binding NarL/FixJ family response regulator [Streptomonospora nanhaiensis]